MPPVLITEALDLAKDEMGHVRDTTTFTDRQGDRSDYGLWMDLMDVDEEVSVEDVVVGHGCVVGIPIEYNFAA